jgi:hypothetical protein
MIERNHQTIKALATRAEKTPEEMVLYYNNTRSGVTGCTPYSLVFGAMARLPGIMDKRVECERPQVARRGNRAQGQKYPNPFTEGDMVYVKPEGARCTTEWAGPVKVTDIVSDVKVRLEGYPGPRHVSHLRSVGRRLQELEEEGEDGDDDEDENGAEELEELPEEAEPNHPVPERVATAA